MGKALGSARDGLAARPNRAPSENAHPGPLRVCPDTLDYSFEDQAGHQTRTLYQMASSEVKPTF